MSRIDQTLACADNALRTLSGAYTAARSCPVAASPDGTELSPEQRRLSGALMRVNHVGEVCAQALYSAQGLATAGQAAEAAFRRRRARRDSTTWPGRGSACSSWATGRAC